MLLVWMKTEERGRKSVEGVRQWQCQNRRGIGGQGAAKDVLGLRIRCRGLMQPIRSAWNGRRPVLLRGGRETQVHLHLSLLMLLHHQMLTLPLLLKVSGWENRQMRNQRRSATVVGSETTIGCCICTESGVGLYAAVAAANVTGAATARGAGRLVTVVAFLRILSTFLSSLVILIKVCLLDVG